MAHGFFFGNVTGCTVIPSIAIRLEWLWKTSNSPSHFQTSLDKNMINMWVPEVYHEQWGSLQPAAILAEVGWCLCARCEQVDSSAWNGTGQTLKGCSPTPRFSESCAGHTLWLFNIAMENGPFIDDVPIKLSIYKGFSMAMLNNQR